MRVIQDHPKTNKRRIEMDNSTIATTVTLEELAGYVFENSKTGNPDNSLMDWIFGSDLDDSMTVGDVVNEWDADRDVD